MLKRIPDLRLTPAQLRRGRVGVKKFKVFCADELGIKLEPFQELCLLPYFAGVTESLLLMPKGQGKTTLLAAIAVWHMLTWDGAPEGYIGASTKPQAQKMYFEAARMAKRVNLYISPGYLELRRVKDLTAGFFRVLASDKLGSGGLEGIGPTLALPDELHAHVNDALYRAMHGALHKQNGQLLGISTAGSNPESMLAKMRARALDFRHVSNKDSLTIAASKDFVMLEWACDPKADLNDIDIVKQANPARFVTKAKLKRLKSSPSMTESAWARYHCNVWRDTDHSWLRPGAWGRCAKTRIVWPDVDEPMWAAVNLKPRGAQGAAITYLWENGTKLVTATEIFDPPSDRGAVGHGQLKDALREAAETWQLVAVAYDEHQFHASALELEDEGLSMRPIKMTPNVWAPITTDLLEAINTKAIEHAPDPAFASHVNAGELRDTSAGQILHGMVPQRVEALIALGMVSWAHHRYDVDTSDWDHKAEAGLAVL